MNDLSPGEAPQDTVEKTEALSAEEIQARALAALRQQRFDLAHQILQTDDVDARTLIENLRIYQAELELQNQELRGSQRDAQEALMRFTALFQGLPIASLVINRQGLVKESNSAAQTLFGLDASHLRQHFFTRMVGIPDRGKVVSAWSNLQADQSVTLEGIGFNNGTSQGFLGDLSIAPLPSAGDELTQFVCTVIDRSEMLRQQQELIATSTRLQRSEAALKERVKELSALHDILLETTQNDQPVEMVLQRVVERLPPAWQFPDRMEAIIQLPHARFQTAGFRPTPWSQTTRLPLDGAQEGEIGIVYREPPPLDEESPPFLAEEQHLLDAVGHHVAVFLARRSEQAKLRASIENYRVVTEYNPEWEYWLDPQGHYRYISPACSAVSGYDAETFIADPELFRRLIVEADRTAWERHIADCKAQWSGAPEVRSIELRLQHADGTLRWIEQVTKKVTAEDGRDLGLRGVNRDITERKEFLDALERGKALLNATGRLAKVGGWELYPISERLQLTGVASEILGIASTRTTTWQDLVELVDPRDQSKLQTANHHACTQGRPYDLQVRLSAPEKDSVWLQLTCQPMVSDGRIDRLVGALQDITARVEAEKALRQAARVFESTAEGVVITDPQESILAVNKAFTEITGYSEDEILGKTPRILQSGRHPVAFYQAMWTALKETGFWRGEIWNRNKQGDIYPELISISAVWDDNGELTHYVAVFRDITPIKRSQEQLTFLAHHDALTGLPNRSLFQLRLEHCIQRVSRYQRKAALLFIDLDRFKTINDTLGHLFGDNLLKHTAEALAREVRAEDTIARLGGDEFVIVLEEIDSAEAAAVFADRIMRIFKQPFRIQERDLFMTASVGVSIYPDHAEDLETLVRHADIAMYRAKELGRNAYALFEPSMAAGTENRFRLEHDLRGAIERNQLLLNYQPQIHFPDGRLSGVEALCRWQHPELGSIPPSRFIPLAEDIGLIDQLGIWVLEESCRQLARWDRQGFRVPRLAVNLSVHQLEGQGVVERVRKALADSEVLAERLELEVTESCIMRHPERAVDTLKALRALGITIAVDDFGTGYSSLAYLKRLPLNRLKINSAFVEQLTQDANDDAIVHAIIALSQSLGLETLAEGVETEAQARFLQQAGCLEAQGYLYDRPLSSQALKAAWA